MRTRKLRSKISKRGGEYRAVCSPQWLDREFVILDSGEKRYTTDFSTSKSIITCVQCLNYLIPKEETLLHGMKIRRDEAIASSATDPWQTNSSPSFSNDILRIAPANSTDDNKPA